MRNRLLTHAATAAMLGALAASPAMAAGNMDTREADTVQSGNEVRQQDTDRDGVLTENRHNEIADTEGSDARELVSEAVPVARNMTSDAEFARQVEQAKGIFIVPDFGRAALGVGARGGGGLMMERSGDGWSNPAFYDLGGLSLGAQAGASGGSIVMLLMTDKAVDSFKQQNNFSLNAEAGISIINWSKNAQGTVGKGDVIMWSDTEGLFAGVQLSVTDIAFDDDETSQFYGEDVTPRDVFAMGESRNGARNLKNALPG